MKRKKRWWCVRLGESLILWPNKSKKNAIENSKYATGSDVVEIKIVKPKRKARK